MIRYRRKRYSEHARPYRYDDLSMCFGQHGFHDLRIVKYDEGLFFDGDFCKDWKDKYSYVNRIRELTYGQWLDEVTFKLAENRIDNL